jgi:hypothetical protein
LPDIAIQYSKQASSQLNADQQRFHNHQQGLILEGDVDALKLIDLDQHGLSYLRSQMGSTQNIGWSNGGYSQDNKFSSSTSHSAYSYGHSQGGFSSAAAAPRYDVNTGKNTYNF